MQVEKIFLLFATIISILKIKNCFVNSYNITSKEATVLLPTMDVVFSRKRRFVLFPRKGTLKFTVFLSKSFLSLNPRGFNFIMEAAFYYPGPWQRIDLIPKPLRPRTTQAPKPASPSMPTYVYIPGTNIHYKAKPVAKPIKIQRIDENINTSNYVETPYKKFNYERTSNWNKYNKYSNGTIYNYKNNWVPESVLNTIRKKPQMSWSKWSVPTPENISWNKWKTSKSHSRWARGTPEFAEFKPMRFPDLEPFSDWKHYHTHRDRRQFFYNFEGFTKILGVDMKLCILRSICDAKRLLLPKGYSLVHDILRVLFTFPTISGMKDDYSRVMESDYEMCNIELKSKCPINLLMWFTNTTISR